MLEPRQSDRAVRHTAPVATSSRPRASGMLFQHDQAFNGAFAIAVSFA